ncbi:MAG: hypothetical protein EBW98_06625 [Actinobacteria bacterium]|nr:hypothetical protein [Actinomycetota bacterium]
MRTDIVDGFRLDRGFQILLTAYPELRRQVDLDALDVHTFDPGALVMHRGRSYVVGDPFRAPRTFVSTLRAPIGTPLDKVRIAMLRSRTLRGDARELLGGNDLPTVVALRRAGFSQKMINRFFRPLFGGIQLDPSLTTSRRMFDIIFRSLGAGDSGLPRLGMGAVPRQMADRLPGLVHLNTRVASVDGRSVATVEPPNCQPPASWYRCPSVLLAVLVRCISLRIARRLTQNSWCLTAVAKAPCSTLQC